MAQITRLKCCSRRIAALFAATVLCFAFIFAFSTVSVCASSPKLSDKSVMIAKGGRQTITLKGGKGKWSIEQNGVAKLTSVTKKSVTVKPLKAGKTVVVCKTGGRKLRCKVRVLNNLTGSAEDTRWPTTVLGKTYTFSFELPKGIKVTEFGYDKDKGSLRVIQDTNKKTGKTTVTLKAKASKAGRFICELNYSDGESDLVAFPFIKGFRGKEKVNRSSSNYRKWRKQVINSLVDENMSTWEIIDAIGYLINTAKYSMKGGASGIQLWYGGNGTCVSGAKMMKDFMNDLGIRSKIHFAGKDGGASDIYGYTLMYASGHKNTWVTINSKRYELNPQPGSMWPLGIVKR